MLNRKIVALILTAALALSLCATALAAEGENTEGAESQPLVSQDVPRPEDPEEPEQPQEPQEETPPAGEELSAGEDGEALPEEPEPTPDPEGTLSFANLAGRVRTGSLQYLVLEESVARVEANDYEKMQEDLRNALNDIANAQWQMMTMGSQIQLPPGSLGGATDAMNGALQGMASMSTSSARQSLDAQYDALREQYDALKDGEIQKEAADGIRQLRAAQDSIVMLTQGMYVQLSELQAADASLDRALTALDRQVQEMELRYQMGQISALTLEQLKGGRTSLVSQRQTLASSAQTLAMNLEAMVGAELTGKTRLAGLPKVSAEQLSAMDLEADLIAAKEASFDLYSAGKTLDDAEEAYKDAGNQYNHNEKKYQYVQAQHAWQAARHTYDGAVQSFELKFRTLYAQVKDYAQVLDAARTALAVERDNYAVDQLKYEQGTISKNALLTAQDDLAAAEEKVATAERNLFSSYNNYRWAVDHGVLN